MLNKAMIIGRIGKINSNTVTSGGKIVNFSVATSEKYLDKKTNEKQEKTTWHNCSAFGKVAEIVCQYADKGQTVYVEGKIDNQEYIDKNNINRKVTQIVVNVFRIIGGAKKEQNTQPQQQPFNQESLNDDIPF